MAVTVKVIRDQGPAHDTTGSATDYADLVEAAIGAVVPAKVDVHSIWDPTTNGIVTVVVLNTNT
jgi:hypothetical protein